MDACQKKIISRHRISKFLLSFYLSGSHRHVGCVGHQGCSLHDGLFLAFDIDGELREVLQDLSHLIASLTTPDVYNDVTVTEL